MIINLEDVSLQYGEVSALKDISISLDLSIGSIYALSGKSGSGKSSLINILGLLIEPSSGSVTMPFDDNIDSFNERCQFRSQYIGIIYQDYHLFDGLRAYENVMIPMFLNDHYDELDYKAASIELLNKFDLTDRSDHYPYQLSGGEKQRVAIARALVNNPQIILADEPTGNLDSENEQGVLEVFKTLKSQGRTVIIASHSDDVIDIADYVIKLDKGQVVEVDDEVS